MASEAQLLPRPSSQHFVPRRTHACRRAAAAPFTFTGVSFVPTAPQKRKTPKSSNPTTDPHHPGPPPSLRSATAAAAALRPLRRLTPTAPSLQQRDGAREAGAAAIAFGCSRVSLRPPQQQVLPVQAGFPGMVASQPPPPTPSVVKKTPMSPKVQMLKSLPSQVSAGKRSVQKELPPKAHPQLSESVRSKFREALAAALSTDSDQQVGQKPSGNVSPVGSSGENRQADGGRMQAITAIFQDAGKDDGGDDDNVTKVAAIRREHGGMLCSNLGSNMTMQQRTEHVPLGNKASGNSAVSLDDLLQGDGLCWTPHIVLGASESMSQPNPKRARMSDVQTGVNVSQIGPEPKRATTMDEVIEGKKVMTHKAQRLAFIIEEELFKLFGEVNKKYKEKGRSLLFNLKDKNNPGLRERVLSGEITPKCLCAMTTEELASKELSEWRMAKAEELAKMVVLPDREVDVRRLVRKTHKGEFQVEVEETDVFPVEVELGGDSLSYVTSEPVAVQTKSDDKASVHREIKESDNSVQDVVGTWNSNTSCNLEYPENEKNYLMLEPMVDDLKVMENLPLIMSLDEFMQVLDSEPHSKDQSVGALQDDPNTNKDDKAKSANFLITMDKAAVSEFQFHCDVSSPRSYCESKLESRINKPVPVLDPVEEPKGDVLVKSPTEKVGAEKSDTVNGSIPESTMQCKKTPDAVLTHDIIWEGIIELSLSSITNIVAIFKSGKKPSTNEWRRFLEIKGRVRLSAFEEFLEQLPKSRSRTITCTRSQSRPWDAIKWKIKAAFDSSPLPPLRSGVDQALAHFHGAAKTELHNSAESERRGGIPNKA
ncbi:PHD finger protein 3 [Triticum urartu]|uniref:PHD finger protein 3 n=1 Tax=Triticum urartu TaxID=4572 RepID=M7ZU58_TRIUA|nr:PHD finger protein 3 [Triticum urartu]